MVTANSTDEYRSQVAEFCRDMVRAMERIRLDEEVRRMRQAMNGERDGERCVS